MKYDDQNLKKVKKILTSAKVLFWDFDGVIKDSLSAKSVAYESLFLPYGQAVADRVRQHHENNLGISRFEKIPLYLEWAEEVVNDMRVEEFCDRFSQLVFQSVVDSPWVEGVREYLLRNYQEQYFVMVTATPQAEALQIIESIGIARCFREVYGAPNQKSSAIRGVMLRRGLRSDEVLFVGDADSDRMAAKDSGVPFLLRRTSLNQQTQAAYSGTMFRDLVNG